MSGYWVIFQTAEETFKGKEGRNEEDGEATK